MNASTQLQLVGALLAISRVKFNATKCTEVIGKYDLKDIWLEF